MKIISKARDQDGQRIVYESTIFDPSLIELLDVDKNAMVIALKYDASEDYDPFGIPLSPTEVVFLVKLTATGIHTSMLISDFGDDDASELIYEQYGNGLGGIEFNVKMTDAETLQLIQRIAIVLLGKLK